jgi:hypothetical protein
MSIVRQMLLRYDLISSGIFCIVRRALGQLTPNCVALGNTPPGMVAHSPPREVAVATVTFSPEANRKYFPSGRLMTDGSWLRLHSPEQGPGAGYSAFVTATARRTLAHKERNENGIVDDELKEESNILLREEEM